MLDLYSLKCQIDHMVAEQVDRPRQAQVRMEASLAQLEHWSADWQALADRLEAGGWQVRTRLPLR